MTVKSIVYVLDRYNISIHGCHELTQKYDDLPRTHLVEGCQQVLTNNLNISKTGGESPEAEIGLMELLTTNDDI